MIKKTEGQLMGLAQKIADENIGTKFLEWKTRPHLTFAVVKRLDKSGGKRHEK